MARLLASLAGAEDADRIIDPMVGSGDMLQACLEIGANPTDLVGVDVDPRAVEVAASRLNGQVGLQLLNADAFAGPLPAQQFDLVITNPPYIRYQSTGDEIDISMPTASAIRSNLLTAISKREGLSALAREALTEAARSYPGNADIAVPAWILSAALVAEGGTLALVAPQTWLSRQYAEAVRRVLDVAFDVGIVVEDGDATWFADAQVRTHLIVARRKQPRVSSHGATTIRARATGALRSGGAMRGAFAHERDLSASLRLVTSNDWVSVTRGLDAYREDRTPHAKPTSFAPASLEALLPAGTISRTLADYGWLSGQGLRTGANEVFYLDRDEQTGDPRPHRRWNINALSFPSGTALPALRRQAQLPPNLRIEGAELDSALLQLRGWGRQRDRSRALHQGTPSDLWDQRFAVLPASVSAWLDLVENAPFTSTQPNKRFPSLSAVAPNAQNDRDGHPLSYWYHVPPLTGRHRAALLTPRVCGGRPQAYYNPDALVVDANFSTFRPAPEPRITEFALLALLNSTWIWANLEASCTVLGGGALKVEAADYRKVPLPDLRPTHVQRLEVIGAEIAEGHDSADATRRTDQVVAEAFAVRDTFDWASAVDAMAQRHLGNRLERHRP